MLREGDDVGEVERMGELGDDGRGGVEGWSEV